MAESPRQDPLQPSWSWETISSPEFNPPAEPEAAGQPTPTPTVQNDAPEQTTEEAHEPQPGLRQRRPDPRTRKRGTDKRLCRYCFSLESPTLEEVGFAGNVLGRRPRRQYKSEDPELGRLIHPCLCSGSVKYVHEGCLKKWRNVNAKAYSSCDLCHYSMKLGHLSWAKRMRSPIISVLLTMLVFWVVIFALGFVADPILDLWFDPVGTIADTVVSNGAHPFDDGFAMESQEAEGLIEHHIKGLFSLGLLGFIKAFLAMTPFQWFNLRAPAVTGGRMRRGGTGRDRMGNINVLLVAIGVFTFLMAVWRGVRGFFDKTLDRASESILNYDDKDPADSDDDHEDEADEDEDED